MNERALPKYDIKHDLDKHGKPIDPAELNPDAFIEGVVPIIIEPRYITTPSGTGKAPNTIAIIDNVIHNSLPEGYGEIHVIAPKRVSEELPDVFEAQSPSFNPQRAKVIKQLGRTGRTSL